MPSAVVGVIVRNAATSGVVVVAVGPFIVVATTDVEVNCTGNELLLLNFLGDVIPSKNECSTKSQCVLSVGIDNRKRNAMCKSVNGRFYFLQLDALL